MIAAGNLRLAGFTTSERAAFRKQFGARGAVNRAVDTATAEERRVCRVHNRINVQFSDVALEDIDFAMGIFLRKWSFAHRFRFNALTIQRCNVAQPLLTARADQFATIRSPAAYNENDRAADLAGPAKIPLCLVSTGNRPSAGVMESVFYESARSFLPCAHRAHDARRRFRFGAKPRRPTGFPQVANENKLATLHARSFPLFR